MDIVKIENPALSGIFDSHAHYDDERFKDCLDEVMTEMEQSGVCGVINCAVDDASCARIIDIAKRYKNNFCAIGYHPEDLPETEPDLSPLNKFLSEESVVAVGEIGLDYYWDKENSFNQKKWFCAQIEFAKHNSLPIIVHDREAHADTLEILKEYKPQGVVHCFSGSVETAKEVLALGMYIGIGGVATFKNAKKCREVIEIIPKDRLLLETDAPYLAPEPYRGKTCHSGMIVRVAETIADIWNTSREEVLCLAKENAERLFKLN